LKILSGIGPGKFQNRGFRSATSYFDRAHEQTNENKKMIYEYYKKIDLWTLSEGVALLSGFIRIHTSQNLPDEFFYYIVARVDIRIFKRAIDTGKLKVKGYRKRETDDFKKYSKAPKINPAIKRSLQHHKIYYWKTFFGDLTVTPFEFLEFIKEKELFEIPPALEFVKKISESGDVQCFWASGDKKVGSTEKKSNQKTEDNIGTPPVGSVSSTESTAPKIEKAIDYSLKTKSEQAELAKRWKEEKKTRREIAKLLYKKEFEAGWPLRAALMKRVDRLK